MEKIEKEIDVIVDFSDITKEVSNPRYTIFISTSPNVIYGASSLNNPRDDNFIIETIISQYEKNNTYPYITKNMPFICVEDNMLGIEWVGSYDMIH